MQSMYLHHRMNSFTVTAIMGIIFFSLCSHVLALDLSMAGAVQLQKDFGPPVQMDETLMTVHVPLNISKMPGAWKNAKGKLKAVVVFFDSSGEIAGLGSHGSEEFSNVSFVNGGYSGTINVPIKKIEGSITSSSCAIGMAFAELGEQVMYLGFATGSGGTSSSECNDFAYPISPGAIFTW